jgi:hypothetical protein
MGWAGHVAGWKMRNVNTILVGKTEGKRPLGRPRCRWQDNISMAVRDTGRGGVGWMHLAQYSDQGRVLVNTLIILGSIKCGEFLD